MHQQNIVVVQHILLVFLILCHSVGERYLLLVAQTKESAILLLYEHTVHLSIFKILEGVK